MPLAKRTAQRALLPAVNQFRPAPAPSFKPPPPAGTLPRTELLVCAPARAPRCSVRALGQLEQPRRCLRIGLGPHPAPATLLKPSGLPCHPAHAAGHIPQEGESMRGGAASAREGTRERALRKKEAKEGE